MFVVLLMMAPPSQELEPPANPGRFNGVLLSLLIYAALLVIKEPLSKRELDIQSGVAISLLLIAILLIIAVWQVVGTWRSAGNTSIRTGKRFWPTAAKISVALSFLGTIYNTGTNTIDFLTLLGTLRDPLIADYTIERLGDTDLILTGAINEKSVQEIIVALEAPSITILRVSSPGGLIEPAIRLARYIRKDDLMVLAETECASACVMLLAASPYSAIYPETVVTFHREESLVNFTNPDLRRENARYVAETDEAYREFGVADWAIEIADRQQYWTPTIDQLVRMNLLAYIYDLEQQGFVLAKEYCGANPAECS